MIKRFTKNPKRGCLLISYSSRISLTVGLEQELLLLCKSLYLPPVEFRCVNNNNNNNNNKNQQITASAVKCKDEPRTPSTPAPTRYSCDALLIKMTANRIVGKN
uniref:Uncharacterized protein n=1 Tax=Glossina pallidipes TaxID=7398 RepID=A0A1B0AC19_GLOPL